MRFLLVSILACDQSRCDSGSEKPDKHTQTIDAGIMREVLLGDEPGRLNEMIDPVADESLVPQDKANSE